MTQNEANERAQKIWGALGVQQVLPRSDGEGSWAVYTMCDIHHLDVNGHPTCHPKCNQLEATAYPYAVGDEEYPDRKQVLYRHTFLVSVVTPSANADVEAVRIADLVKAGGSVYPYVQAGSLAPTFASRRHVVPACTIDDDPRRWVKDHVYPFGAGIVMGEEVRADTRAFEVVNAIQDAAKVYLTEQEYSRAVDAVERLPHAIQRSDL